MIEPSIWLQLGISDDRYNSVIVKEIASILATNETIGNMMLMVQGNTKLSYDEKFYLAFAVAKEDVKRRLIKTMPGRIFGSVITKIMEE